MDGDDRAGAVGERAGDGLGVHEEGVWIDVDEDRAGSDARDRLCRGDERVRRDDHVGARLHADRAQRELDGVGAVGQTDAMPAPGEGRVVGLEGCDVWSADEPRRAQDLGDRREDLVEDLRLLGDEVEEGDGLMGHGGLLGCGTRSRGRVG